MSSLLGSAGSSSVPFVNDFMSVGRNLWWRVVYDNISTDGGEGAVRVKANSISNEISAVLETLDLVDHAFVGELGI